MKRALALLLCLVLLATMVSASAETLQRAYEHPELHRNLVVRVGGFSDYFNNLTDEMKRMIIARSIHK